jgi:hypothetical protein
MPTENDPMVGNWYRHLDKGQEFQVIVVDETDRVVDIQHFDGDVESLDLDAWYDMDVELIEAPEDWTGPVDDVERDDLGYEETDMEPKEWSEPMEEVRSTGEERPGQGSIDEEG